MGWQAAHATRLLHRHALGQVAGLVDGAVAHYRHVVGQQLQGDDVQHGLQGLADVGHGNDVIGQSAIMTLASSMTHIISQQLPS